MQFTSLFLKLSKAAASRFLAGVFGLTLCAQLVFAQATGAIQPFSFQGAYIPVFPMSESGTPSSTAEVTRAERNALRTGNPLIFGGFTASTGNQTPVPDLSTILGANGGLCSVCMAPAVPGKPKPKECAFVLCPNPTVGLPKPKLEYREVPITPPANADICKVCSSATTGAAVAAFCPALKCGAPPTPSGTIAYKRWLETSRINMDVLRSGGAISRDEQNTFLDAYRKDWKKLQP